MKKYTVNDLKPGVIYRRYNGTTGTITEITDRFYYYNDSADGLNLTGDINFLLGKLNSGEYTIIPSIHPVMQETIDGILKSVKLSGDIDYRDINGPEEPEEPDWFDKLQEDDIIINTAGDLLVVYSKEVFPMEITTHDGKLAWTAHYVNSNFRLGLWYNITGLEEQGEPNAVSISEIAEATAKITKDSEPVEDIPYSELTDRINESIWKILADKNKPNLEHVAASEAMQSPQQKAIALFTELKKQYKKYNAVCMNIVDMERQLKDMKESGEIGYFLGATWKYDEKKELLHPLMYDPDSAELTIKY